VLVALGSFGVILLASRRGYEADRLDDYKGLHQRDPLLAFAMMLLMFSTAGVPPLVGFWAKLRIFQALWETNHLWVVVLAAASAPTTTCASSSSCTAMTRSGRRRPRYAPAASASPSG